MKKYLLIGLLFISSICSAMTFSQAKQIYSNLVKSNGFASYPILHLSYTSEVNADYGAGIITINRGMLNFVKNADELALILGHELGHYTDRNKRMSDYQSEYAADKHGAIYEDRAGYNSCRGSAVIFRFHDGDSYDHPASLKRFKRISCL